MNIKDKSIIITGASSGIGEATAKLLAKNGAKLILGARRLDRLENLVKEIKSEGGEAVAIKADVTNREDCKRLASIANEKFGRIDVLVNNAGVMPLSFLDKLKIEEWDRMIDTNIKGVLYCFASVLPTMKTQKSGHIVNISSVAGRRVMKGGAVYCASKFAVTAVSEGIRQELSARDNIRVTCIEPGAVTTELGNSITDNDVIQGFSKAMAGVTFMQPNDIAESILYAISQPNRVNVNEILIMPTEQPN